MSNVMSNVMSQESRVLYLHQTFADCLYEKKICTSLLSKIIACHFYNRICTNLYIYYRRQKCRDEKKNFVIVYGFVSLVVLLICYVDGTMTFRLLKDCIAWHFNYNVDVPRGAPYKNKIFSYTCIKSDVTFCLTIIWKFSFYFEFLAYFLSPKRLQIWQKFVQKYFFSEL